jgi:hypothetical protein
LWWAAQIGKSQVIHECMKKNIKKRKYEGKRKKKEKGYVA